MATLFVNGRIFTASGRCRDDDDDNNATVFHDAMVVEEGVVAHVGEADDAAATAARAAGAAVRDLSGRTVVPGFVDGHTHLLTLGFSLQKVALEGCSSLADIRAAVAAYAAAHPKAPRILCRNWMFSMTPDGVTAAMLDDLDTRPIYVDSKDLHATWCSTAALQELGLWDDVDTADGAAGRVVVSGGTIHRDAATGRPTGLLSEAAVFELVWPRLARLASLAERTAAIATAVDAYTALGYTGVVDMGLQEEALEALLHYMDTRPGGHPPIHVAAYWLVTPQPTEAGRLAQVDRAAELMREHDGTVGREPADMADMTTELPSLRIVGIKVICDGIVDGCTAALTEPYGDPGRAAADALWTAAQLGPVVRRAAEAGLQVALHAIGDAAVTMAVDAIAAVVAAGDTAAAALRPRLEHLELASAADAARLGRLGITASIQPVHADPAILRAWPRLLGAARCARAFPYRTLADAGAPLAIGTDAPTAPREPLANAYVATTRRSAREPDTTAAPGNALAPVNPHLAITLCEAVTAATRGAAYSVFAEGHIGSLEPGKAADFAVVDMAWDPAQLLAGRVDETWFAGQQVFRRDD